MRTSLLLCLGLALAGCTVRKPGEGLNPVLESGASNASGVPTEPVKPPREALVITSGQARAYLRQLSPLLVSRELSSTELAAIDAATDGSSIKPILEGWAKEPALADAARRMIELKLSVGGTRDGVDFNLPGNMVAHLVKEALPFSRVLTADYCIGAAGERINCDHGAPYTAGVLGTRAFLKSRASRFNLTRASTMMKMFACKEYPMGDFQQRLDKSTLIPLFQANVESEQQDPSGATSGFGNGIACYNCHSQFGQHAQLFVRFDRDGLYVPDATGQQDPTNELGKSFRGLMTSHLNTPAAASSESSVMLTQPVQNLGEAARVLAQSEAFLPCQVRNILEYTLDLNSKSLIREDYLKEIAQSAGAEPSWNQLVVETFNHPSIIKAVVDGLGAAQ
jgi:hypothetical protein